MTTLIHTWRDPELEHGDPAAWTAIATRGDVSGGWVSGATREEAEAAALDALHTEA